MSNKALPTRFDDVEFFPADKLNVKFTFKTPQGQPLDVSSSKFTPLATASGQPIPEQPAVDMTQASVGVVWIRWTQEQAKTLPRFVSVQIAEAAGLESIDPELTWDELDIAWEDLDDFAWSATAIWDRTILFGRLVRNEYGRYE